ncbi:MAG: hypothetical protein WD492_16440 [Alkalispirochaeta sp.]
MVELGSGMYASSVELTGREIATWLTEISENDIERVYALVGLDEFIKKLPQSKRSVVSVGDDGMVTGIKTKDTEIPVVNRSEILDEIPNDLAPHLFWETAFKMANTLREDARVLLLDQSDCSRAATLFTGVRMVFGDSYDDVCKKLPEKIVPEDRYATFLKEGITEPIAEKDPGIDDDAEATNMNDILNPSSEELDRFDEWVGAPDNWNREQYYELNLVRNYDPILREFGLRSLFDPLSRQWPKTSAEEKYRALRAVLSKKGILEGKEFHDVVTILDVDVVKPIYEYTKTDLDRMTLGSTLLLQDLLAPKYALPVVSSEVAEVWNRYQELRDGRKVSAVRTRLEKSDAPVLGREQFDSLSHEGSTYPVERKIEDVRKVVTSGIPLLDAVMLHQYHYRAENRRYVLEQLPLDMLALTAVVVGGRYRK